MKRTRMIGAIVAAVLMLCVFSVSAFAAAPLSKSDFDLHGEVVTSSNYVTEVGKDNGLRLWETPNRYDGWWGHLGTRGVGVGSTKSEVYTALSTRIPVRVNDHDAYADDFDPTDVPIEKVTYSFYKTGRMYYQAYYFDDEARVCLIVWYNGEA